MEAYEQIIKMTAEDGQVLAVYCWEQTERPRAALQIFHGMAEHALRYGRLAEYLNREGIVVFADDHRGHGKTSQLNGIPGVIGKNGFYNIVEDEYMIAKKIKEKYPGIPHYILAHSFGSFIGQEFMTKHGELADGIILSGSAAQKGPEFIFGRLLAFIQMKLYGEEKEARLVDKLNFGINNKKIKNPQTSFDWLSRDAAEVKKYIDDQYCGFVCSSGFYYYLISGLLNLYRKEKLDKIPKQLPVFIIAGQEDPVGKYGKRVIKLYDIYKKLGLSDLEVKLYENCRHEILNELNRDEVTGDILNWINNHSI